MVMQSEPSPLRLPKACTVERIAEVRQAVLERFAAEPSILLNISEVAEVDVTFVQLALALEIAGREADKPVAWQGGPSVAIERALRLTGHWSNPLLERLATASGEP